MYIKYRRKQTGPNIYADPMQPLNYDVKITETSLQSGNDLYAKIEGSEVDMWIKSNGSFVAELKTAEEALKDLGEGYIINKDGDVAYDAENLKDGMIVE